MGLFNERFDKYRTAWILRLCWQNGRRREISGHSRRCDSNPKSAGLL